MARSRLSCAKIPRELKVSVKLSEQQIKDLISHKGILTYREIAKKFDITPSWAYYLCNPKKKDEHTRIVSYYIKNNYSKGSLNEAVYRCNKRKKSLYRKNKLDLKYKKRSPETRGFNILAKKQKDE
jgi:hypothetical protein